MLDPLPIVPPSAIADDLVPTLPAASNGM
jgi:hypothetical protein